MTRLDRNAYFMALCLSGLAGFVDAVGFLYLGGFFVSFMSGNSTRFAAALVSDYDAAGFLAVLLLLFVGGAFLGSLVRQISKTLAGVNVLLFVTVLLWLAAGLQQIGLGAFAIFCLVVAMGAENAVFQRSGDVVIGLTYMTGTLVKIGQKLAAACRGEEKSAWVPYAMLWLSLIAGGVAGAILYRAFGLQALWLAAAFASMLLLAARNMRLA